MVSRNYPTERRCLHIEHWPQQDVDLWHRITTSTGPLRGDGIGAKWRKPTEIGRRRHYGRWLSYLTYQDQEALEKTPFDRITEARVRAYISRLEDQNLKPVTIQGYIIVLLLVLRQETPGGDLRWLSQLVANLKDISSETPAKQPPSFSQKVMLEGSLRYMDNCAAKPPHLALDVHVRFRDGLMIALQTARALRPLNLTMIDIGTNLIESSDGYRLVFSGDEIKTGEPYDIPFPSFLAPYLETYLKRHRPHLLCGNASNGLWISNEGRKMPLSSVSKRFKVMTRRLLGLEVNPHAFRHGAATFVATEHPRMVSSTPAILHHSTGKTVEKYYTIANTVAAGQRYQDVLQSMSRRKR